MFWLVVTGTMEFYDFPFSWECHPNWRTPSFFRGVGWNHQPDLWGFLGVFPTISKKRWRNAMFSNQIFEVFRGFPTISSCCGMPRALRMRWMDFPPRNFSAAGGFRPAPASGDRGNVGVTGAYKLCSGWENWWPNVEIYSGNITGWWKTGFPTIFNG